MIRLITAKEWKAYIDGVAEISDKTEQEVIRRLLAWNAANPDATVAETREYAKTVMEALVQSGSSLASSFAAKWYDYRAEQEHVKLDQAITAAVYNPKKTDAVARYQAKKLVAGSFEEFAKACGEYARNDALRALNETIMANAKRDRSKGVRFARVPTGRETCTFCIMLAGRGAVYHSRQTAGEFRHFHRGCDCKIAPGFEEDPDAELVEGCKPEVLRRQWRRIESRETFCEKLYGINKAEIAYEADSSERLVKGLWRNDAQRLSDMFSSLGAISFERGAVPKGKEIQVAEWLARLGWDILFRNDNEHLKTDGNTSDFLIKGETWDLKRITSSNPNKIARSVFGKERQGPNFIIDLSLSEMGEGAALIKCASILEDDRVNRILLIHSGKAVMLKK